MIIEKHEVNRIIIIIINVEIILGSDWMKSVNVFVNLLLDAVSIYNIF